MAARKRFGQHFLHDPGVIERLVDAIDPQPGQRLVEIGPGKGALTRPLLARGARVDAIELDRDLIPALSKLEGLRLHQCDALRADYAALAGGDPIRVVGNLPYNISSPLLFTLLGSEAKIIDMQFMLQWEVVQRIVAEPGSRTYGRLSVAVAARADAELLMRVGNGAFAPPPKVESAVVRLRPRPPDFTIACWETFDQILTRAFSARRKTLRNALKEVLAAEEIVAAGIDPGLRPERLAPADFAALANRIAVTAPQRPR